MLPGPDLIIIKQYDNYKNAHQIMSGVLRILLPAMLLASFYGSPFAQCFDPS